MSFNDFMSMLAVFVIAFMVCLGGCDHILLSLVYEDEKALRKRVNDLELRIYRIELKQLTTGEVSK